VYLWKAEVIIASSCVELYFAWISGYVCTHYSKLWLPRMIFMCWCVCQWICFGNVWSWRAVSWQT
jgi:hypothetical protein